MKVQATVRRADIAKILIKKGFHVVDIIEDPDFHWSTNFIFEASDALQVAYDDALKQLHLKSDDPSYHRGKHYDNYDKSKRDNNGTRGGYDKYTNVVPDKVKDEDAEKADNVVATTASADEVKKDA